MSYTKAKEAVIFQNEDSVEVLFEGLNVKVTTDGSENEKELIGVIEWITVDEIKLEDEMNIPLDYIEEIVPYDSEYGDQIRSLMKRWKNMRG